MQIDCKRCPCCGETKELSKFYKDKTKKLGVSSHCKECRRVKVETKVETKRCRGCRKTKKLSKFAVNELRRYGVATYCKKCEKTKPKTKRCPSCGLDKWLSEYALDRTKTHGVDTYCKNCNNLKRKEARANAPKSPVKYLKRFYEGHRSDLDYEAFMEHFLSDNKFMQIWDLYMQTNYDPGNSPRIFRKKVERGYELGNLMVWARNSFKRARGLDALDLIQDRFKES